MNFWKGLEGSKPWGDIRRSRWGRWQDPLYHRKSDINILGSSLKRKSFDSRSAFGEVTGKSSILYKWQRFESKVPAAWLSAPSCIYQYRVSINLCILRPLPKMLISDLDY